MTEEMKHGLSYTDARLNGLPTFIGRNPCKKCGGKIRRLSNCKCINCVPKLIKLKPPSGVVAKPHKMTVADAMKNVDYSQDEVIISWGCL